MAKDYGPDRLVEQYHRNNTEVNRIVSQMLASGNYSMVEKTSAGGIIAIEKGKAKHKADEIEAARHMAEKGYRVTLKDETGDVKTPDGHVYSFTYEQRTPQKGGVTFKKALDHAAEKMSDVAVIYDKHYNYHRQDVENGIKQFEYHRHHRFKRIIVISQAGNVYEHSHNK